MADITLTGNLGSDSELTFTPNGKAKLEFSVGDTPRRLNQQTNEWEDAGETTWWRVTEWDAKAEALVDHLKKGTKVLVVGSAGVRTYDKKDGTKGWSAEIKPRTIALVPRQGAPAQRQQPQQGGYNQPPVQGQGGWGGQPQNSGGWGSGNPNEPAF
jgi:single-strand DNA-binding protein